MPWGRYETSFIKHPKVQAIPRNRRAHAIALHLAATLYAGELLTNGFIPTDVLPGLAREAGITAHREVINALADTGLFEETTGGYIVHDYLDYNPSAADVKAKRQVATDRQRRHRTQTKLDVTPNVTRDKHRDTTRDEPRDTSHVTHPVTRDPRARATRTRPDAHPTPPLTPNQKADRSKTTPNGLPPDKAQLTQRLLTAIGNHADQGTPTAIATLAHQLPLSSLAKTLESLTTHQPRDRAAYAIGALQSELADNASCHDQTAATERAHDPKPVQEDQPWF